MFASTKLFHVSGISLALCEGTRNIATAMLQRFKEEGAIISLDVNFRGTLWSGEEARECLEKLLPYVDIFFCSEDTARLTFDKTGSVEDIMMSFTVEYPISVVATTQRIVHSPKFHTFGSIIYCRETNIFYREDAYERIEVVDRTGSGDAYVSGVLYALLSDPKNYQRAVEFGNAQAAVKNTIPGDIPTSNKKEIESVIADHHNKGYQSEMYR